MMVMTAKVDKKKIGLTVLAAAALVMAVLLLLAPSGDSAEPTSAPISSNDARVQYLKDLGWEVTTAPKETSQVRIPETGSEVFDRYNALQKSQGFDLSAYAGKQALRFVYQVSNFPGATEPVYATVLVYKDQVIGGDITDTSAQGKVQGLK